MLHGIDIGLIILAYLLGSINCAIIACKAMGLPSPFTVGSGNPGATNVLRLGNKKAAIFTLIGDALKGLLAVVIGHYFEVSTLVLSLIALFAVLGHIFPIFFKFKGGKGVATFFGVIIAINPWVGACAVLTWLVMAVLFRYSSLAALTTCVFSPVYAYIFMGPMSVIPLVILALIVVSRHHANIKRLCNGSETKIGQKKP